MLYNAEQKGECSMKEMLSKETFCKALQLIREQQQVDRDFGEALNMVGEGHFVFGVPNKYLTGLLLVLKEAVHDQHDYIGWWLFEDNNDFKVSESDGSREWDLTTAEALYDFLVSECQ